ncbi:response regulator [Pseudozobellia thermophila]|uniref:Response regulator receiver domain-containing protein n=1 Tax=Pseudozobellia thermophila TaxID=192903 RepID=A0A1M6FSD5_9FLAO|nr:response regulator [Pseudozobellia thermophila]SHJ00592.1 Response regulator receiver domain-containing protein [Pseudozobellia thermophila]
MKILFIEDDQVETMKMKRTVARLKSKHELVMAGNGQEALDLLESSTRLPDLILLDLNMPRMNGNEFLKIIKQNDTLKYIPVVVLTTSQNRDDLVECYCSGIAGYVIKPLKYEDYVKKMEKIFGYWEAIDLIPA